MNISPRRSERDGNRASRFAMAFGTASIVVMVAALTLVGGRSVARAQNNQVQAVGSMSDIMVSMVYPAANNILLSVYRGGPANDADWTSMQRSGVLMAETGNLLATRAPGGNQADWARDAKMLTDAGAAVYKAARAKDTAALLATDQAINASCTNCHKQFRFNSTATASN